MMFRGSRYAADPWHAVRFCRSIASSRSFYMYPNDPASHSISCRIDADRRIVYISGRHATLPGKEPRRLHLTTETRRARRPHMMLELAVLGKLRRRA